MPPRRAAASASAAKPTRSSRGRATAVKDEPESDDELALGSSRKPAASRTSTAKSTASSRNSTRAKNSKRVVEEEESEEVGSPDTAPDDASDDSQPEPPKRVGRARAAPRAKAAPKSKASTTSKKTNSSSKRAPTSSDEDEKADHDVEHHSEEDNEENHSAPKPSSNPRNGHKPNSEHLLSRNGRKKAVIQSDDESEPDNVASTAAIGEDAPPSPSPRAAPEIAVAPPSSDEEDLLPQTSLRASAAPPSRIGRSSIAPSSRIGRASLGGSVPPPPPPVEIETGPKSRLVIHKMALVNFKSYKGRQEIGPFHKVCF